MKAQRSQLQSGDVNNPDALRRILNDIFLDFSGRLEALEATRGIQVFEVAFDTSAAVTPTSRPWANAGVRMACPFTPSGLVVLSLVQTMPSGQPISALASDVKWHFAGGDGQIVIDFVTGLNINSSYKLRVGVTRA